MADGAKDLKFSTSSKNNILHLQSVAPSAFLALIAPHLLI